MGEIKLDGYLCDRCDHSWVGRNGSKPLVCPKCKSPYWNIPKKNGNADERLKNGLKEKFGLFPTNDKGKVARGWTGKV